MRLKITSAVWMMFLTLSVNAQVWFPEGVFPGVKPSIIAVDNQIMSVGRLSVDVNNSYWLVSVYDGKIWVKLPVLVLNKAAEISDVKKFKGELYISGSFTMGNVSSLVKFNGSTWVGLGEFKRAGNLTAAVSSLEVYDSHLIIAGNFIQLGNDTIPYLMKFDGSNVARMFDCKGCEPDNSVVDIESNDSSIVFGGTFTKINGFKSKYLYRWVNGRSDTFTTTPKVIDKLALDGDVIYAAGGILKDKKIYRVTSSFVDLKSNMDSTVNLTEILVWERQLIISGALSLNSSTQVRNRILRLNGSIWTDITNNFKGAERVAAGRGLLFAAGESNQPLSIWNPNRFLMRFYPGMCLVKINAFIDSNNNCIREKNEKPAIKQYIKLPFVNRGVFTTDEGLSEFMIPNAVANTQRIVVKPFRNLIKSNCADTAVSKTFVPGNYSDSIQFPLNRMSNVNDIRVSISSPKGRTVIKNKRVIYYLVYENMGSNAISGTVFLKKSKFFNSEICLPLQKNVNDSVVSWDYSDLKPGERKVIYYSGLPNASEFAIDYRFDAKVSSQINSGSAAYLEDDADSIPQEVEQTLSAFRKDVFPTPKSGDSITYVGMYDRQLAFNIAFNNFSADTVFYAVVIDTLDLNLDMSFIQETGSNKSYFTEVQTDPNNQYKGILIWHFPNIKLAPNPGKDYENQGSGAYIGFKVVTKPMSVGYTLKNVASVFYDNNYAGNTNAVYVRLDPTDIDDIRVKVGNLNVYPNPVIDIIHIQGEIKSDDVVQIYDLSGKLVKVVTCNSDSEGTNIDISELVSGIYQLVLVSDNRVSMAKISVLK